jgi:uncharacterized protein involved in exopolysaccharide biosynthesis
MAGKDPRQSLKDVLGDRAPTLLARSPNAAVFEKALASVEEERSEELLKVAADKIKAALDAERQIGALEKEFNGKIAKAKKALAKLLGPLRSMSQGKPPEEPQEPEPEPEAEEEQQDGGGGGDGD